MFSCCSRAVATAATNTCQACNAMRVPLPQLANVVGYQLVWFACVAGASAGLAWPGVVASLLFSAATLMFAGRRNADLRTLAIAVPLGFGLDSMLVASGLIAYSPPGPATALAPVWIGAIWLSFAMTLNHSLAFLRPRRAVSALLGLVGGPFAYWSASRAFGVIEFAEPVTTVVALGLGWAALLPLVFTLDARRRLAGVQT